jgi:signal peptidase I
MRKRTLILIAVAGCLSNPLTLALVARTFFAQPFSIPSGSMVPTLAIGEHVFAAKWPYGYSQYSLPWDGFGLVAGRTGATLPALGDVVVFRKPGHEAVDYVKRVVGLPGDRIQMQAGVLHINGVAAVKTRVEPYQEPGFDDTVPQYQETLPNGVSYRVLDVEPEGPFDTTAEFTVPPGAFFAMGDNRDNSSDSRDFGAVPLDNLVGRMWLIFQSQSEARLFTVVR